MNLKAYEFAVCTKWIGTGNGVVNIWFKKGCSYTNSLLLFLYDSFLGQATRLK